MRLFSYERRDDLKPFLDLLRSSPRLVTIKVVNGGPSVASRPPHFVTLANPRINLSYLEVFIMSGSTSAYEILPHSYAPVCVHADVSFIRRDHIGRYIHAPPIEMELDFPLPLHSHFWDGWLNDDVPIQSMNITAESQGRAFRATYTFVDIEEKKTRQRRLVLRLGRSNREVVGQGLSDTMQHISRNVLASCLSDLPELHVVNFEEFIDTEVWERVLSPMRNLTTLVLRNTAVPPVLDALRFSGNLTGPMRQADGEQFGDEHRFTKLRYIDIQNRSGLGEDGCSMRVVYPG